MSTRGAGTELCVGITATLGMGCSHAAAGQRGERGRKELRSCDVHTDPCMGKAACAITCCYLLLFHGHFLLMNHRFHFCP